MFSNCEKKYTAYLARLPELQLDGQAGGNNVYGKQGIRVNTVLPSVTLTPALFERIPKPMLDALKLDIMNLDYTDGDKIATVISFLLSDDAYTIQGATIPADNGYLAIPGGLNECFLFCFHNFQYVIISQNNMEVNEP